MASLYLYGCGLPVLRCVNINIPKPQQYSRWWSKWSIGTYKPHFSGIKRRYFDIGHKSTDIFDRAQAKRLEIYIACSIDRCSIEFDY